MSLTCYLWHPPDSRLMLGFLVGHGAFANQSTNWPCRLMARVDQPVLALSTGARLVLEAAGSEPAHVFLDTLCVCVCVLLYQNNLLGGIFVYYSGSFKFLKLC